MARAKLVEQNDFDISLNPKTKTVHVKKLEVRDPEFFDIIFEQTEDARGEFILKSLKMGAIALRDITTAGKVDYVKGEFQKLCSEMDKVFNQKLGPEGMKGELDKIFGEAGKLQQCLDNIFGKDGKLARDILDLDNKKSPIDQLRETMESYFVGKDSEVYGMLDSHAEGSPLYCLRKELTDKLENIENKITEQVAKKEVIEKAPQKGFMFEDALEGFLIQVSRPFGDTFERTGVEKGKLGRMRGDFVISINDPMTEGHQPKIVVEAKAGDKLTFTQKGIIGELDEAIKNREASFAIAVTEHTTSAAGCYRALEKDKIICSFEHDGLPLEVAYRVARVQVILNMHRENEKEIDTSRICGLIEKIGNDLRTLQGIKTKLTHIVTTSDDVSNDLDQLEKRIRESLAEMQEIIRRSGAS